MVSSCAGARMKQVEGKAARCAKKTPSDTRPGTATIRNPVALPSTSFKRRKSGIPRCAAPSAATPKRATPERGIAMYPAMAKVRGCNLRLSPLHSKSP